MGLKISIVEQSIMEANISCHFIVDYLSPDQIVRRIDHEAAKARCRCTCRHKLLPPWLLASSCCNEGHFSPLGWNIFHPQKTSPVSLQPFVLPCDESPHFSADDISLVPCPALNLIPFFPASQEKWQLIKETELNGFLKCKKAEGKQMKTRRREWSILTCFFFIHCFTGTDRDAVLDV